MKIEYNFVAVFDKWSIPLQKFFLYYKARNGASFSDSLALWEEIDGLMSKNSVLYMNEILRLKPFY